ncbi:MAG TPA: vWA domain-containing protein [Limnochordales bacterium]
MTPPGILSGWALGAASWLMAGAAAALAIVLLHLVRPRPRPMRVSSLLLWRWLQQESRQQSLLRRLMASLLLLLQLAAAALMGLALARPQRQDGTPPLIEVFVADRSLSMQAKESGVDRFTRAREELARRLQTSQAAERHSLWVGSVGPSGTSLAGPFGSVGEAARALASIEPPTDGRADFDSLVRHIEALASRGGAVRVWLGSDGVMDAEGREALQRLAQRVDLRMVHVGDPAAPNVAVTALQAYRSGATRSEVDVMAEVANLSDGPVQATLRLQGDSGLDVRVPLDLPAGARTRVVVPYRVQGPGSVRARLELPEPDALPADDVRVLAFSGEVRAPVAYLVGEPATPLVQALRAAGAGRVVWVPDVSRVEPGADLVVFAGVDPPATPGPWDAPVWWVWAPDVPTVAGTTVDEEVVRWERTHPLLRFVELDGVRASRSATVPVPPPDADVLVEGTGGPLVWHHLDDSGRHRIIMAFAPERSDLPDRVAFAVLVANVLRLAAPWAWEVAQPPLEPGQALPIPVPPGEERILLVAPDDEVVTLTARGSSTIVFSETERAGVYSAWPVSGGADPLGMWAVQPPGDDESDLRTTGWAPSVGGVEWPQEATAPPAPRPLWRWAAAMALATLVVEAALYLRPGPRDGLRGLGMSTASGAGHPVLTAWQRQRRRFVLLRAAAMVALMAALADPMVPLPSDGRRLVFVVDTSRSLPAEARAAAYRFVEAVLQQLGPRDRAWVVEADRAPRLRAAYRGARPDPDVPLGMPAGSTGEATDLEAALHAARSLLTDGESGRASPPGRIVLLSDGRQTAGDALAAVREDPAFPPVDVVPVLAGLDPEVAVASVTAPASVAEGEPVAVRVRLWSSRPQQVRLALHRDGTLLWEGEIALRGGWHNVAFEDPSPPAGPVALYEAVLSSWQADLEPSNNRAGAAVRIEGHRRLLYVASSPSPGSRWLSARGIPVEVVSPETLPDSRTSLARYSAIVLDDVPASSLSSSQMDALAASVRDMGVGLVVLGGPKAFGPGGYLDTPLEELLPVRSEVPARLLVPQVALVLVIDKSGSMGERDVTGTKLDAARRAAAATLELLSPDDLVGVLAFDGQPRWVQPLSPASDPSPLLRRMATLTADGGTDLGPALREALGSLESTRAMVRHVIVLSDGKSNPADFEGMTRQAAQRGITVSTVAIGPDADAALLAEIARWGRGRFYQTRDLRAIPQIFASETIVVTRSAIVAGPVQVRATGQHGVGASLLPPQAESPPPLEAYVATTPKPDAPVYLVSQEGDPILAAWRAGLGRVVAFTSSLTGPWTRSWHDEGLAAALLDRMARWVLPPADASPGASRLYVELGPERGRVVLEALDDQGRPVNFLQAEAIVSGPGGVSETVPLRQEAPGRYTGAFDASEPGGYVATVAVEGRRLQAVALRAYPAELEPGPPSPSLLSRLAHETGGQIVAYITPTVTQEQGPLPAPVADAAARLAGLPPAQAGGWRTRPAWPWLIGMAMALLVADVGVRRLTESPAALLTDLVGGVAAWAGRLRRPTRRPSPSARDILEAKRQARPRPLDGPSATGDDGGVDPARAARLYLARLRRERRGS